MVVTRPRHIHPSCVEIGDLITVTQIERKGITTTNTGRVREIKLEGQSRFYFTQEHAIIFAIQDKMVTPQITVHNREPQDQTPLFEMSA